MGVLDDLEYRLGLKSTYIQQKENTHNSDISFMEQREVRVVDENPQPDPDNIQDVIPILIPHNEHVEKYVEQFNTFNNSYRQYLSNGLLKNKLM